MNTTTSTRWTLNGLVLFALACSSAGPEPVRDETPVATRQGLGVQEAVFGPEFESGESVPFAVAKYADSVRLAANGAEFFAVAPAEGVLRGTRLSAQGDPLGPDWPSLGASTGNWSGNLTVALGGEHFLVVQQEDQLTALLVDKNGQAEGVARPLGLFGIQPELVWNGQNFGLTWLGSGNDDEYGVHFALLDARGNLLSDEVVLRTPFQTDPCSVAAGGSHFLVACMDRAQHSISAFRIGFDGRLEQPAIELSRGADVVGHPVVASNGDRFFVAWLVGDFVVNGVHGSLLDETGAVAVPDFEISAPEHGAGAPAVASDGVGFATVWTADRDSGVLLGSRVSAEGQVSPPATVASFEGFWGFLGIGTERHLSLASNGLDYLAAMNTHPGLYGALFASDLTPKRSGLTLRSVPNSQSGVQAVWDGANYRLSWIDGTLSPYIGPARGTRITSSGERLAEAVFPVSEERPVIDQRMASARHGESLTVLWAADQAIEYSKSLASGESTPPKVLADEGSCNPHLASSGDTYLAVYCRPIPDSFDEYGSPYSAAWGALFDGAGGLLRTFPLAAEKNASIQNVLPISGGYLVAFDDGQLHLTRFNQAGDAVGTDQLPDPFHWVARGARGDTSTLILFYRTDGPSEGRFYGETGWLGDAFPLPSDEVAWGSVAFDGTQYWVAWSPEERGVHLLNITQQGVIGSELAVAPGAQAPLLTGSPNDQLLLSYLKYSPDWTSARLFSRLVSRASSDGGGTGATGGAATGGAGDGAATGGAATGGVGGFAGAAASGGSADAAGGVASGGVAGSGSGGPEAGSFGWPGGVGPFPSCSYGARRGSSSDALPWWFAASALAISLSVARRRRRSEGQ